MRDATALAWSGFKDSAIYDNANSFNYEGGILSKEDIGNIMRDYITTSKGVPLCQ